MNYFYGELLEQIFNFFQGPLKLISSEQLVMNQSGDNDFHVIAFVPEHLREQGLKNLKNFRKFNTKNTDRFFHFKYWMVEDKALAQQLGMATEDVNSGDVYLLRPASPYNLEKSNIKLCGYDYSSKKLLSSEEILADVSGSVTYAKILENAFNSPLIIRDFMQYGVLTQKFKTNTLVIYCDPEKDPEFFRKVQKAMVHARKQLPINLVPDESGTLKKQQRHNDVLLILSTLKNLPPVIKIHEDKPQALFVTPEEEGTVIDLFKSYLVNIQKVEGMSRDEYLRKAVNVDKEFAYAESDDDQQRNKKDTQKLIYSPERFFMSRMYQTADRDILTDPDKLVDFVKSAVLGQLPLYWETEKVPKKKYTQKVVGEDFEKRVLESKKDVLLLVTHPIKDKNRDLLERYEELARDEISNSGILLAKYNGVNESQQFRSPQKLPALLYFRRPLDSQGQPTGEEKEVIAFENINELLVKSIKESEVQDRIRQFIRDNRKVQ